MGSGRPKLAYLHPVRGLPKTEGKVFKHNEARRDGGGENERKQTPIKRREKKGETNYKKRKTKKRRNKETKHQKKKKKTKKEKRKKDVRPGELPE